MTTGGGDSGLDGLAGHAGADPGNDGAGGVGAGGGEGLGGAPPSSGGADGSGGTEGSGGTGSTGCALDCALLYDLPSASGVCDTQGTPTCIMACDSGAYDLDGVLANGCEFTLDSDAVYVSVDAPAIGTPTTCGLGPSAGTGGLPCSSIALGIARAQALGRSLVQVADGAYEEPVTVANGISIVGGYDPLTWQHHPEQTLTVIRGSAALGIHRAALVAQSITTPTLVEGLRIEGVNNTTASGNSYAVYVSGSDQDLEIRNNVILAGDGGPGIDRDAASSGTPGATGGDGQDARVAAGTGSCNASNNLAGTAAGVNSCGTSVNGGLGGGSLCPPSSSLTEGSGIDGSTGNGSGAGAAADAGDDMIWNGTQCALPTASFEGTSGGDGSSGMNGNAGLACTAPLGTVVANHWVGGVSGTGVAGNPGGGGGGGGAGGGSHCNGCPDGKARLGATGGGGGAGGCGGGGALGGGPGGGSFGVFVVGAAAPTLRFNSIWRGEGGRGGRGGSGGTGGAGGAPGLGGLLASISCVGSGGDGGSGGPGGHGGAGGGGCGGSVFGIYTSVTSPPNYCEPASGNSIVFGVGGSAGPGGLSLGNSATAGASGLVIDCQG